MAKTHSSSVRRLLILSAAMMASLAGVSPLPAQTEPTGPPPAAQGWRAVTVAQGIRHPWGIAWLKDGRPIITGKFGTLHVLSNGRFHRIPMEGLPQVFTQGQGALMDISLHPNYAENRQIYMTMSTGTARRNRTILIRGVFDGKWVRDIRTLFQVEPLKNDSQHFGSRLLWLLDGTLLMSVGDGGNPPVRIGGMLAREQAQNLRTHLGSILRLREDGKPAPDNPLRDRDTARPDIWTYGHRNIQGLARDAHSGRVWANEHGPKGGDELNLIEGGRNYGWPRVTQGRDYRTGEPIGQRSMEGMTDPKAVWIPAHAPSGLVFYTGNRFPNWSGSLFSGGLVSKDIRRIALDESGKVLSQNRFYLGRRVRDVTQGPDGCLYAITDEENGHLIRIEPQ